MEKPPYGFCKSCGSNSKNHEMRNYYDYKSLTWHEGDIFCELCGAFVRRYDAG